MRSGEKDAEKVLKEVRKIIEGRKIKIDYLKAVNLTDLADIKRIEKNTLIAVAAWVGKTRLIDNILLRN